MLSRLSLRARLIGAFAVTTLFLLGMGAVALTATRTINAQLVAVQSDSLPSVAKAGEISGWVARYAISIYRHLAAIDPIRRSATIPRSSSGRAGSRASSPNTPPSRPPRASERSTTASTRPGSTTSRRTSRSSTSRAAG